MFKKIKQITYLNYFNLQKNKQPKEVNLIDSLAIEHKGNYIIKEFEKSYLYIVNGVLIANRCGYSIELLKKFIETDCKPLDYTLKHEIDKTLKRRVTNETI